MPSFCEFGFVKRGHRWVRIKLHPVVIAGWLHEQNIL
jgi:hypothetical protein